MGCTYSPATRGQDERAVGTLKQSIEACSSRPLGHVIRAAVFTSNSTPRFGGISPSEVFLGRKMRDVELDFADELKENEMVATMAEIQSYWKSKIN